MEFAQAHNANLKHSEKVRPQKRDHVCHHGCSEPLRCLIFALSLYSQDAQLGFERLVLANLNSQVLRVVSCHRNKDYLQVVCRNRAQRASRAQLGVSGGVGAALRPGSCCHCCACCGVFGGEAHNKQAQLKYGRNEVQHREQSGGMDGYRAPEEGMRTNCPRRAHLLASALTPLLVLSCRFEERRVAVVCLRQLSTNVPKKAWIWRIRPRSPCIKNTVRKKRTHKTCDFSG